MAWSVPSNPTKQWLVVSNFTSILGNTTSEDQLLCYAYAQNYTGIIVDEAILITTNSSLQTFLSKANSRSIQVAVKFVDDSEALSIISYNNSNSSKFEAAVFDLNHISFNNSLYVDNRFIDYYTKLQASYPLLKAANISVIVNVINSQSVNYNYGLPVSTINNINTGSNTITLDWVYPAGYIDNGDILKIQNYPTLGNTLEIPINSAAVVGYTLQLQTNPLLLTNSSSIGASIPTQFGILGYTNNQVLIANDKTWLFDPNASTNIFPFTPTDEFKIISLTDSAGVTNTYEVTLVSYDSVNNRTQLDLTTNVTSTATGTVWLNTDVVGTVTSAYASNLSELQLIYNYGDEFLINNYTPTLSYQVVRPKVLELAASANLILSTKKVGFLVDATTSSTFFTGNSGVYPRKNSVTAYKYLATSTALSPAQVGSPLYAGLETDSNVSSYLTLNSLVINDYSNLKSYTIGNGNTIYAPTSLAYNATGAGTVNIGLNFCDDCLALDPTTGLPSYSITYTLNSVPPGGAVIGTNCGFILGPNLLSTWTVNMGGCKDTPTATSQTLQFTYPGTYSGTVVIKDTAGPNQKTVTVPFTVRVGSSGSTVSIVQTGTVSCPKAGTNQITVTVGGAGNVGPYGYEIYNPDGSLGPYNHSPGASSPLVINNIGSNTTTPSNPSGAGTYSIYIVDLNPSNTHIIGTYQFNITEPTPIEITSTSFTSPSCTAGANGTATAVASGGTAPYTYTWSPGSHPNASTITGLAAGTYTVSVTDSHACTPATASIVVVDPPVLSVKAVTSINPTCYGGANGSIQLDIIGGATPYTYTWANNAGSGATAFNLIADDYSCTITDANGCTLGTGTITLTNPAVLDFSITGTSGSICYNPSTKVPYTITNNGAYTGPYQYIWSNSTSIPTPSTSDVDTTTYNFNTAASVTAVSCQVIDSFGCTATFTGPAIYPVTIGAFTNADYVVSGGPLTNCSGSTLTITVSNSEGYGVWNDAYGTSGPVLVLDSANFYLSSSTTTSSINITSATGVGNTIVYTTATPHGFTGNTTEYITVTGLTPVQFNTTGLATIISPTSFSLPGSASHSATGVLGATASTTYSDFVWTEFDTVGTGSCALICDPIRIYAPAPITISADITGIPCNSPSLNVGAINLTVLTGCAPYTYSWTRDGAVGVIATTQDLTGQVSDTYHVTITDTDGNTATYDLKIGINEPEINLTQLINTCNGLNNGSIDVVISNGTAPYTYSWVNTQTGTTYTTQDLANLGNGEYTLTVTDSYGCTAVRSFIIKDSDPIVVNYTVVPPSCPGVCDGSLTITSTTGGSGSGNYTYSLSGSQSSKPIGTGTFVDKLCANGTYQLSVTDGNGCAYIQNVTIPPASPEITITYNTVDPNPNTGTLGSITVTSVNGGGGPAYNYVWVDSTGNQLSNKTNILSNLSSGTYYLTITGPNNTCGKTFEFTLQAKCDLFSITELKLQLYKFQCCAGKLADKYVQYQNVGRPELAECLLVDLKYLTLALDSLTCITDLPDPCLSCDDISNILDQMKKICDCDCCLDAGDHTYQVSYNYNTGVFTPILPAIN